MKKFLLMIVVLTALTGFGGGAYAAEVSTSLDVSTTVPVLCSVQATGIDFLWEGPVTNSFANGDVTVTCQLNLPYNIALDAGLHFDTDPNNQLLRALAGPDPEGIGYLLYQDPGNVSEWGDSDFLNTYSSGSSLADTGTTFPQPHTVYGILGSANRTPTSGSYSDVVGVTVYF